MRHIGCLIKFTSNAQISNLNLVVACEEHIYRLDVPMQDPVSVQILKPEAHFNEELPDSTLSQMLAHLLFQILTQVLIFAKLHDNIELVARLERIIETNDIFVFKLVHQEGLTKGFLLLLAPHSTKVYLFEHIECLVLLAHDFVDYTEGSLTNFLFYLEFA